MEQKEPPRTVAVVGSGLAGLVTAYLLHHDPQRRYRVRLLEKVCCLHPSLFHPLLRTGH